MSGLPSRSSHRVDLTNSFLNELWSSLEHPPSSYLGDKFQYRQPDGSYNVSMPLFLVDDAVEVLTIDMQNIHQPMLGAAMTPYARSVRPDSIQPGALPDPGLLFDSLFARRDYREHPNRVSSILYYWASLIIHGTFRGPEGRGAGPAAITRAHDDPDLFQTSHKDYNISMTV